MQKFSYIFNVPNSNIDSLLNIINSFDLSEHVFLDIETTGLSAKNSICYLIGLAYYKDNSFKCTQFFADTPDDEPVILQEFLSFISRFKAIVTYNGDTFDIPYIISRCKYNSLSTDNVFPQERIDLYKTARQVNSLLKLDNLKQKNIENFLSIDRDDIYSGGELIDTYKEYIIKYKLKEDTFAELSHLLLHNREDVCALPELCGILSLRQLLSDDLSLLKFVNSSLKSGVLNYKFKTDCPFPKKLVINNSSIQLNIYDNIAEISINITEEELKHFYKDYKNYYYIPEEGQAIHKSVAAYVDTAFKEKATKENCFTKKKGDFLPAVCELEIPRFKSEYNSTDEYFLFNDTFLNDESVIRKYCAGIIKSL
ncbi:MAG: ribonuclease H-like domain-containing protein [Lachnospira sp.]